MRRLPDARAAVAHGGPAALVANYNLSPFVRAGRTPERGAAVTETSGKQKRLMDYGSCAG